MLRLTRDKVQIRVRPQRRALIVVPAAAAVLAALTACSSDSSADARPGLSPGPDAGTAACTDLLGRLPATVLSKARNDAQEPAGAASWGDPAITLNCGVTPTGPTASQSVEVNDVCWVIQETTSAYSFLTYGRDPAVLVSVPTSVERTEATAALVDLDKAVGKLPKTGRRCLDITDS